MSLAREHRRHHENPSDLHLVFVPALDLVVILAVSSALLMASLPIRTALTTLAVSMALLGVYEWTHFLIHTSYRPRARRHRSLARAHRLHHHRNERYWLGVTSSLGDRAFGTYPARSDVALSPTARTLAAAHGEGSRPL